MRYNQHAAPVNRPEPSARIQLVAHAFAQGLEYHKAGRLEDAERFYRMVVESNPRYADALHLLGLITDQIGRHEEAVALIGQAIALEVCVAPYRFSLGNALKALASILFTLRSG